MSKEWTPDAEKTLQAACEAYREQAMRADNARAAAVRDYKELHALYCRINDARGWWQLAALALATITVAEEVLRWL